MVHNMRDSVRESVRTLYEARNRTTLTDLAALVTWVFLSFDILCLFIQSAGGGIASTTNIRQAHVGSDIALVGIAAQTSKNFFPPFIRNLFGPNVIPEVAIGVYSLVAGDFIWRLHANKPVRKNLVENLEPSSPEASEHGVVFSPPAVRNRIPGNLQLMFFGLGVSTLFLLIRAIYRLVEFANGWGHRVQSTEAYFNILDGGDVVIAMFAINFLHPGWLLPKNRF